MKRRALTAEQQELLVQWFRVDKLSSRTAHQRALALGWDIGRTALDTYRREILGAASESAPAQVRHAAASLDEVPAAAGAAGEELGEVDDLVQIGRQLRKVLQLGLTTDDPTVAAKSLQTAMAVTRQLDALRLSRNPNRAPAAVIYLPAELPDPEVYDPNDPKSWPDNPFLRAPFTPDPAVYPPLEPQRWPNNPYGCPARSS